MSGCATSQKGEIHPNEKGVGGRPGLWRELAPPAALNRRRLRLQLANGAGNKGAPAG